MPKLFGECYASSPGVAKLTLSSVIHGLFLAFFVSYTIVFLISLHNPSWINLWTSMITWGSIGGVLFLVHLLGYVKFHAMNADIGRSARTFQPFDSKTKLMPPTFTGLPFAKEMTLAFVTSTVAWILGLIFQLQFLFDHKNDDPGEGCCSRTPENVPDVSDPMEWRSFTTLYVLTLTVSLINIFHMTRALIADVNPMRCVTHLVEKESARRK
jgi:hypothetical protein